MMLAVNDLFPPAHVINGFAIVTLSNEGISMQIAFILVLSGGEL